MRRFLLLLSLLLILLTRGSPAHAQGPTDTPTPTPTDTPTITATATITPTPDVYFNLTLEPSGQDAAVVYVVTAGQAGIFAELAFIIVLLLFVVFLALRRSR